MTTTADPCFSLDGWSDKSNVSKWLQIPDITKVELSLLGAHLSGALTRHLKIWTSSSSSSEETKEQSFVLKIGDHDKGMGRYREAAFYGTFVLPTTASDKDGNTSSPSSLALSKLKPFLPKCYFSRFDTEVDPKKDKSALVIEFISGSVESGLFFGRHNPNNWRFKDEEVIKETLKPWLERSVNQGHVCVEAAKLAARLHGPFWNKTDELIADKKFEHAACRDWYAIRQQEGKNNNKDNNNNETPESWQNFYNYSHSIWAAEKARLAKLDKKDDDEQNDSSLYFGCVTPFVAEVVEASFQRSTWKNVLEQHMKAIEPTFVHGDFHPANFLVRPPGEGGEKSSSPFVPELVMVDFEMFRIGSGPQELGQFMISHCRPEVRREHEAAFLEAYLNCLRDEFGVTSVDAKYVKQEYVEGGVGRFLWFIPILCNMAKTNGKQFGSFFNDQVEVFLKDHGITAANAPIMRV